MLQNETKLNTQPISQPQAAAVPSRKQVVRIGPPVGEKRTAPDVQLLRNNDTVETIIVRCGCGEEIRLDCVYQPSGESHQDSQGVSK